MLHKQTTYTFYQPYYGLFIMALCIFNFYKLNAQTFRTEYKVLQTIHAESNLHIEYEGIATVGTSMYLYIQKTKPDYLQDEIRMSSENGNMVIYRPNPDSLPKIIYRAFDSSIIRYKIGNNTDDIQFYIQEQIGNSIHIKLINESKVINGFHCRKALFYHPSNPDIVVAAAWYCPEIKIKAGPADLSGLPGLIIEAEHFQTREKFSLIRFREVSRPENIHYWPEQFNGMPFLKLAKLHADNR